MESTDKMESKIVAFSRQLAEELGEISWEQHGSPFAAIEARAAEIGDRVMREISAQRSRMKNETPLAESECCCPDCQRPSELKRLRQRELQTIRGTTEITQPEHYCKKCRRSFFPSDSLARS